ncbi:hypothetical protein KEM52_002614, partial [Ascosphaera acerosa]
TGAGVEAQSEAEAETQAAAGQQRHAQEDAVSASGVEPAGASAPSHGLPAQSQSQQSTAQSPSTAASPPLSSKPRSKEKPTLSLDCAANGNSNKTAAANLKAAS